MICTLNGVLTEKKIDVITVDVAGVGYEVYIPLKAFSLLPEEGKKIFLYIQMIFKEDGYTLYGFFHRKDKDVFNFLRMAKGVGAKTAFNLLSSLEADELINLISTENKDAFVNVPGVGRKTAERIIFELKDKIKKYVVADTFQKTPAAYLDVELALISLGYSPKDAKDAIQISKTSLGDGAPIEDVLKTALKVLVKR